MPSCKKFLSQTTKKYELEVQETQSKNIEQFMHNICGQIELDSKFRDIKKWFKNYRQADKWQQLHKVVNASHKTNMQMDALKNIFDLQEEEDNPFLTMRDTEGSIPHLVESYVESEEHWQRCIGGKLQRQEV